MLRLTLKQNALHSLHHAVEHLDAAERTHDAPDVRFDSADFSVVRTRPDGSKEYYSGYGFTKPPAEYNYKFAVLHLIHGLELLIKAYLQSVNPDSIFVGHAHRRTISLRAALQKLLEERPALLDSSQEALLLAATEIRNTIEHFEFSFSVADCRQIAIDFLSISNYLAHVLLDLSLAEEFGYDPWKRDADPVGQALSRILADVAPAGRKAAEDLTADWRARNPADTLYHCLSCGTDGASLNRGSCVNCGEPTDEETGRLLLELDQITTLMKRINELRHRHRPV